MEAVYILVGVGLGLFGGLVVGSRLGRSKGGGADVQKAAEQEAEAIRTAAKAELESIKQAAEIAGKEAARKHKADLDEELRGRRNELKNREEALATKERELDR